MKVLGGQGLSRLQYRQHLTWVFTMWGKTHTEAFNLDNEENIFHFHSSSTYLNTMIKLQSEGI